MLGLLDPILPEGNSFRLGIGAARQNRIPRWLVEVQRLNRLYFLSDVGGQLVGVDWPDKAVASELGLPALEDVHWEQGIYTVSDGGREISLEEMSIPLAAATIHFTTDVTRFLDPMTQLAQAQVRVSYYDGIKVRRLVRGLTEDNAMGFDGEPTSFRIVEKWRTNPPFPPAKNEKGIRVSESRIIEGSEDQAYPYAFGDAWAVPVDPIRSFGDPEPAPPAEDADEEEEGEEEDEVNTEEAGPVRMLIHGTSLTRKMDVSDAGRDAAPYVGFPHPEHPSNKGRKASTVVGLWYGRNRVLRDAFERVGISAKWKVVQGTFAQNESGATQLESTADDATLRWSDWNYEETLSLTVRVEKLTGSPKAVVYWNHVDADNHARVEFPFGGTEIRVVVRELGVDTTDEAKEIEGGIPADEFRLTVDVATGKLSAGVKEGGGTGTDATVVEFGQIAAAVGGRIAIGSLAGTVRFHYLAQPSMKPRGLTEADTNAAIRNRKDKLNHSLVCEDYKEQPGLPMFADFHRAQNTSTAGQLLERLVRDYSGLSEINIDERTFSRLVEDLDRIRVGAYFNEQQPIFDIITERLSKELPFVLTQEAGTVKGFMFDPTRPPDRKVIYGIDLLELAEPIREFEKFNEFQIRWKKNAARGNEWGKSDALSSENFDYFLSHRRRYGRNPFPRELDFPDVVTDGTAQYLMLVYALIFHAGQRAVYLQRATPGGDYQFGDRFLIDDPARGWSDKRAFLVGRTIVEPGYVLNVFRTVEYFEEAGSGGAHTGIPVELPPAVNAISQPWESEFSPEDLIWYEPWDS